jgi:hypothetical protein
MHAGAGAETTERLLDAGSFGSGTITHRVALTAPEEVDAELEGWLRDAYNRARVTVDPAAGDHRRAATRAERGR